MKDYALAALAGVWLANGMALLVAPRFIIAQVRELLQQSPAILRWELLGIIVGIFLYSAAQELPYQSLWMVTAGGMIAKGAFLSIGPHSWRGRVIDWCVGREDVDYRIWGARSLYACGPVTPCARVGRSELSHAESWRTSGWIEMPCCPSGKPTRKSGGLGWVASMRDR